MGFFLLIALICGVVSATSCTKSSCAQLQVVYETYGSLSTGSPVEVTVGRNVWLSTDASSKRVASHFDFVEPGKVNVAVKNIPSPSTSRMECIDLTASTGGKTFSQSSSISLSAVAGHQFQCTVRVFGARISTGKREVAPPVNADVSIVKGGSNSSEVGSPTLYQFTLAITNAGVNDAQNLVVTDLVDPRLTIRNINAPPLLDGTLVNCPIPTNPIGPVYGNNVTCTFPLLRANLTATITIQYLAPSKVSPGFNPIINNTASVTSTTFDSDLANNQNSHIVQLVVIADLRASLNGPQNVTAGNTDNVFYTMTVCNNGLSNALNVFGNWTLPPSNDMVIVGNVVPISSLGVPQTAPQFGSCTVNGQFIRCTLPELNNTQCQSYRAEVNIPSTAQGPIGGIVNMNATVGSDIQDLDLNNNFATLPVQILVISNLRITKSGDLVATAGDNIGGSFSIVVTNAGPSMAYGVVMTDAVPVQFQVQPATIVTSQGTCTYNQQFNVVRCQLGNIAATPVGQPNPGVSITFRYLVPAGTNPTIQFPSQAPSANAIQNNATVTSVSFDPVQGDNTDPAWVDILALADVFVTKNCVAGPLISGAGVVFNYTISVGNRGPSNARNVRIVDVVPSQFNIVGPVVTSGPVVCSVTGNTVACNGTADLVPAGGAVQIQVFIPVTAAAGITVDPTVVNNTVTVSISTFENATADNTAFCVTTIRPPPDVSVTKTGPASILIGNVTPGSLVYTMVLSSNGPTDATGVTFNDVLPAAFLPTLSSVVVSGMPGVSFANNCAAQSGGNTVACNFGTVPVGTQITISVPFTIVNSTSGIVQNCANVNAFLDTNPNNNQACFNTTISNGANLIVSKSSSNVCAGTSSSYVITFNNAGPAAAANVFLVDTVPAPYVPTGSITVVQLPSTPRPDIPCSFNGNTLTCSFGTVAANSGFSVSFSYNVASSQRAQSVTNRVQVNTTTFELDPSNNFANSTNQVLECATIGILKTGPVSVIAGTSANGGLAYQYTLTVSNTGFSDAANVTVSDNLPTFFTASSASATGGGSCTVAPGGASVSCSWPGLFPAGSSQQVFINFAVSEAAPRSVVQNCATVVTTTNGTSIATSCANTTVITQADVAVTKNGPLVCVSAGQGQASYIITVNNRGPSRAYTVSLTDSIPAPFVLTGSVVANGPNGAIACTVSNNTITCPIGDLVPNNSIVDQVVVTYNLTVPQSAVDQLNVVNTATVTSLCSPSAILPCQVNSQDPNLNNNVATFSTNICAIADLLVQKICTPGPIVSGTPGPYLFTVSVTNRGPAFAYNVVLADVIPAALTNPTVIATTGGLSCLPILRVGADSFLQCAVSPLAVNASASAVLAFAPVAGLQSDLLVTNFVNATSSTVDPTVPNIASCTTLIVPAPDVAVTKTGPGSILVDQSNTRYQYNLTVTNLGPTDATNVTFLDVVPSTFVVDTASTVVSGGAGGLSFQQNCAASSGNTISCLFPTLPVNSNNVSNPIVITIFFTVPSSTTAQSVTNCANVTAYLDRNPLNNNACWLTTLTFGANLKVTKSTNNVCAGSTNGVYVIDVFNAGPASAQSVVLSDNFPSPLIPTSVLSVILNPGNVVIPNTNCTIIGSQLSCFFSNQPVNTNVEVRVGYSVSPNTRNTPSIVNTVTVNSTTVDLEPASNSYSFTSAVTVCVDVTVVKTGISQVTAGLSLPSYVYSIAVSNAGPSSADSVSMSDVLPSGLIATSFSVPLGSGAACTLGTQQGTSRSTIVCNWSGLFAPNRTDIVQVFFRVDEATPQGTVTNCATVSSPSQSNTASSCFPTNVITVADVSVNKVGPTNCVGAGTGAGNYVITVSNFGPSRAYDVVLTDNIPAPFVLTAGSLVVTGSTVNGNPSCSVVGSTISCSFGPMRPNIDSVVVSYTLTVPPTASSAQAIANTAVVTSGCSTGNCPVNSQDPNLVNNNSTALTNICAVADLSILKSVSQGPFIAGAGSYSFTLAVANNGPSYAYNVTVTDLGFTGGVINSISSQAGASCSLATLSCFYTSMANNAQDTIVLTFTIPASQPCGPYSNTGTIASSVTIDNNPNNNNSTIGVNVIAQHDLSDVKLGNATVVEGGDAGQFVVVFSNKGPSDATNVVFTDNVPSPLVIKNVTNNSTNPQACGFIGNLITCNFGRVPVGTYISISYWYTIPADAPLPPVDSTGRTTVVNTACVNSVLPPGSCESELANNNCANFTTEILCRVDLAITKDDGVTTIVAGNGVTYTFTIDVKNIGGPSQARTIVVTDSWPGNAYTAIGIPTTNQPGASCFWSNPNAGFVCNLQPLSPNATVRILISYTVGANVPPQTVVNTVTVSGSCQDTNTTNNIATDTNTIINQADLGITKDDCVSEVVAGNPLPYTFTFTVTNSGPSSGVNVVVSDSLPPQYTPSTNPLVTQGTVLPTSCSFGPLFQSFTCNYASFPVGGVSILTFSYYVNSTVMPQYVTNCATVSSGNGVTITDPNPVNNEDCDTNKVITLADLEITKSMTPGGSRSDCVVSGETALSTYTVNVINHGPSVARSAVVHESFPAGVILVGVPGVCQNTPQGSQNYTCQLGDLPVGTTVSLTFTFYVNASTAPGIIINRANVESLTRDPELCNNNVTLPSLVCAIADLVVYKNDGVSIVTAGDNVTYVYNITGVNNGPSNAVNVVIDDVWPGVVGMPGFTLVQIVGAQCNRTALGFVCSIGNVPVGGRFSFCVYYKVDACMVPCTMCNSVQISSDVPDPNPSNNVATDCNEVRTEADLAVCKTDGVTTVVAGDNITYTYTMTVTNYGPSCALKVTLADHFPKDVFQIPGTITTTQGSCVVQGNGTNPQDFSCTLLTLNPGASATVKVSYSVPATVRTCSIRNTVVVSSITFDPELCNNVDSDVNALVEKARLRVTKTATASSIPLGFVGNNTFFITVVNDGPSVARDVVLTDTWPYSLCQYPERITVSQGAWLSTGGDITASFGDIGVGPANAVVLRVPFSVCAKSVAGPVVNHVSVFSPTDNECREATYTITLTPSKKREVVEEQKVIVQEAAVPKATMIVQEAPAAAKPKRTLEVDARLSPLSAAVSVQKKGKTVHIEVTNKNNVAINVIQTSLSGVDASGRAVEVDAMESSAVIKSTTCQSFVGRKLAPNWSERCSVELSSELTSVRVIVSGSARKEDGKHPVVGAGNAQ